MSGRAGELESRDLRSSRALIFSNISVGTGSVLIRCRPEGMWCDAVKNDGTQDLFTFLAVGRKSSFAHLVFNLSTVSIPVCLFQVDAGTMLYRIHCDIHPKTNEDW